MNVRVVLVRVACLLLEITAICGTQGADQIFIKNSDFHCYPSISFNSCQNPLGPLPIDFYGCITVHRLFSEVFMVVSIQFNSILSFGLIEYTGAPLH